jgi:serine/threonine protein phosphatase PrpC
MVDSPKPSYRWKVTAVSVSGSDHENVGTPCQDAHYFKLLGKEVIVSAVADGAGSALYGDVGAKIAVQTSVKNIISKFNQTNNKDWKELLTDSFKIAIQAIEKKSEIYDASMRDFATTLILTIACSNMVVAAQVGDGAMIINGSEDGLIALTKPQNGEYINETSFIVSQNALDIMQIESWQGSVKNMAVISDGLQMLALKMPEGTPHAPFFMPLFNFISNTKKKAKEQLESFLRSQRVRERTTDDLTLLLASIEEKQP